MWNPFKRQRHITCFERDVLAIALEALATSIVDFKYKVTKAMSELKDDLVATKALLAEATTEINTKIQLLTDAVESGTITDEDKALAKEVRTMAQGLADLANAPTPPPEDQPTP